MHKTDIRTGLAMRGLPTPAIPATRTVSAIDATRWFRGHAPDLGCAEYAPSRLSVEWPNPERSGVDRGGFRLNPMNSLDLNNFTLTPITYCDFPLLNHYYQRCTGGWEANLSARSISAQVERQVTGSALFDSKTTGVDP
ncbi:MAG: hypothetical protein KDI88_03465 [Gammaproteobacteria bacterium]|nr:hypothetical protein [Gammaproteobacteria bacterium]